MRRLADFVVRWPWAVIGVWIAIAVALPLTFPSLNEMAQRHPLAILPSDAPSSVAARQMTEAFHESGSDNLLVVAFINETGLKPADEAAYRKVVDALRDDVTDVVMIQDFFTTPQLRPFLTSKDKTTWVLPVGLAGELGTPRAYESYNRVADLVKHNVRRRRPTDRARHRTRGHRRRPHRRGRTGPPAHRDCDRRPGAPRSAAGVPQPGHHAPAVGGDRDVVGDRTGRGGRGLRTLRTGCLKPVRHTSERDHRGRGNGLRGLSHQPLSRLSATRGRSRRRGAAGADLDRQGDHRIRRHGGNHFSRDQLRPDGGVLHGRRGVRDRGRGGIPCRDHAAACHSGPGRAARLGQAAARTHRSVLATFGDTHCAAAEGPPGCQPARPGHSRQLREPWCTTTTTIARPSDLRPRVRSGTPRWNAISPISQAVPEYILVQSPRDLRTPQALADLEQMAQRVSQLPNIGLVSGITRPTGVVPQEFRATYQAGIVGDRMAAGSDVISDNTKDLNRLTNGAGTLAASLGDVRAQINRDRSQHAAADRRLHVDAKPIRRRQAGQAGRNRCPARAEHQCARQCHGRELLHRQGHVRRGWVRCWRR